MGEPERAAQIGPERWEGTTSFLHRTDRGELRLSLPAPSVILFKYKGHSDGAFMAFIERVWDATVAQYPGRVQVFVDTEEQTGYVQDFRARLMSWSKRTIWQTDVYFLLVKSRWVAMGIAIARATVGLPAAHAEVTTDRRAFDAKLSEAVERSLANAGAG
jgi:hypothetical protein